VFRVKLFVSSIHSCIHHHLYPNTEKDMAWMVSRLLQLLLVAYQPRIGRPPQDIRTACANVCLEWSCLSPLFIHAFIITCIQIQRKIWPEWSPGYCSTSL
jgi:hypothetical protein